MKNTKQDWDEKPQTRVGRKTPNKSGTKYPKQECKVYDCAQNLFYPANSDTNLAQTSKHFSVYGDGGGGSDFESSF